MIDDTNVFNSRIWINFRKSKNVTRTYRKGLGSVDQATSTNTKDYHLTDRSVIYYNSDVNIISGHSTSVPSINNFTISI